VGWEWVNLGFLAGGLVLLGSKIFTWHGPVAMLAAMAAYVGTVLGRRQLRQPRLAADASV